MDDNRFFRFVWRFNAIAIAGVVVLGGLLSAYAAMQIVLLETRDRDVTNVVNVDADGVANEEYVLGSPNLMPGSGFARIALYRIPSRDIGSYSKSGSGNEVNFLFLNTDTNASGWMMPHANQLFLTSTVLADKLSPGPQDKAAATGIVYVVAEKDSDGDQRLTQKDKLSLTVSDPDGTNYRKLADGIERVFSVEQIADDKVLALYQKDKSTLSELYRLPGMTLISQKTLPKVDLK